MSHAAHGLRGRAQAGKKSIYSKALAMQSNGKGHKELKHIAER